MTEIVVLSDSNESVLSLENDGLKNVDEGSRKKSFHRSSFDLDTSEFEFPEVQFYHASDTEKLLELQNNSIRASLSTFPPGKSPKVHSSAVSTNTNSKKYNVKKSSNRMANSSDSTKESDEERTMREKPKVTKTVTKKARNQITEERLKRQKQLGREKALKAIASKKSKNIKPGECLKFMEVVLDKNIESFGCINEIVSILLDANVQYSIKKELIPNSITWKRNVENGYVDSDNEICTVTDIENVNQIVIIWNWDKVVTEVADGSFCTTIFSIKASLPNYSILLVIFGIENYFIYSKQVKNPGKNGTKNKHKKAGNASNHEFKNYPQISKEQLEMCLDEIQIIAKCSSRLINNSQELAQMIHQCTKAIAEIPFKMEKNENLTSKFDWYVMGDNRNTVSVDKNGNGLKRLWQQQLCQFNLSSLEIAEAISSVYKCPADLMEAYKNCTQIEGQNLLKDIPIRRAAGPLTATRKVGPELSKKMYIMFSSKDGEIILS
ncbi:PREDICTED: crossover junction endonuclease EME1 [Dufourea novaeangliae]|uniref:Crossover junction endonuclease EME1 n=1 Tax=Dufourea novaeangliae TaxID=178035 RepID=A0A154PT81_DUFNO|nr:PREDICTED: crossover junction endonuclease EME1 [Dufourea novaeangliae]KZC14987.1 Crossover junction endonuclease EME1 [Dufourea novaeangliae]